MKEDTALKEIFADPDKRREWIKYQLRMAGSSTAAVARELGLSRQSVYTAMTRPYPKMERALAKRLGVAVHELFPERHRTDGSRITRKRGPKPKNRDDKNTNNSRGRNMQERDSDEHREAA